MYHKNGVMSSQKNKIVVFYKKSEAENAKFYIFEQFLGYAFLGKT